MGREEERETLAGLRPEHDEELHEQAREQGREIPEPDWRGHGEDTSTAATDAYAAGDPDAVPTDVTDSEQYQEALAEVRREVKEGEAVVGDGNEQMPPTSYDRD